MSNQDLDKLAKRLELDSRRKTKTRKDIIDAFETLKSFGVIQSFKVTADDTSGKMKFTFVKSKDWYLDDLDKAGEEESRTSQKANHEKVTGSACTSYGVLRVQVTGSACTK